MTSSPHGLYAQGYTRARIVYAQSRNLARVSAYHKEYLRWNMRLQLDSLKLGSLVNAYQRAAENTFSGLVHTPRHTTRNEFTTSGLAKPSRRQAPKVWLIIRVKS